LAGSEFPPSIRARSAVHPPGGSARQ